jgi:class 3 adenylate cyclase/tetratricopeptide (TPR) repeat protein
MPADGSYTRSVSESRKTVTVVFSDVSGSTALGERLDPEALRQVMARYFDETRAVLEHHGGTVEKFIGDAVMAVFGIPSVHEDDALRAVRAAAEMRDSLAGLNAELEQERGVQLEVRTGVNTGEVVVGDPFQRQSFATGDAVNVAARLEQAAKPGEIVLGEATYHLVRDAVHAERLEPLALKGKAETVPAWRLLDIIPGAPTFARRFDSPLVGRGQELHSLREAFERARRAKAPVLVSVLGAAGVGKSRLTTEFITAVEEEATVLVGRCLSYGEGITYWPVVPMLEQIERRAPLRDLLADVEAGEVIAERVYAAVGRSGTAASMEETFWAVRKLVAALARERPLVIVVDDVQWAEPMFLDLLEHVIDWTRDAAILLICIARPEFIEDRPSWPGERIALEPLSDGEADVLIDNLAGEAELRPVTRRRITQSAEGNPLFVEQMLAMLAENDDRNGEIAVPPTIHALLAARLDQLPADERATIERASVVGKEFWHGAVLALSPPTARVTVSLQRLVRKEFIRPDRSTFVGEDAFRFGHILIRDAAYAATSKQLRAELHERFAGWLEAKSSEYDEIVGYHLEQAFRYRAELGRVDEFARELAARAIAHLGSAGRRAFARGDVPAAANLLWRATALFAEDDPRRLEFVPELGYALCEMGELAVADRFLTEASEQARRHGDRRVEAYTLLHRAQVRVIAGGSNDEAIADVERAVAMFEELGDERSLAHALERLGLFLLFRGQLRAEAKALERALVYAKRTGDEHVEARIRGGRSDVAVYGSMPVPTAIRDISETLAWARARSNRSVEAQCERKLAILYAMAGNADRARELVRSSKATYADLGFPHTGPEEAAGIIEMLAGDPAAAERHWRIGYELHASLGEMAYLSTFAANLAHALHAQGRDAEAAAFTRVSEEAAAADDVLSQFRWRSARAKVLARRQEFEEAEALAREAVGIAAETDFIVWGADTLMDLADVLRAAGRVDEAIRPIQDALALYEAKGDVVSSAKARAHLAELQLSLKS